MYSWSKFWRTSVVIMFFYHLIVPDLKVETFFEKDEAAENGGAHFEIVDIGSSAYLYWKLKEISCRACLLLNFFDMCFHPPIIEFRIEEKYTVRLLLTCLESLEEGFSCFPGRDLEGLSRNILSPVKLYQRIWIWDLDHYLVMTLLIVAVCIVLF